MCPKNSCKLFMCVFCVCMTRLSFGSFGIWSHSFVVLTKTILFDDTFYYVLTTPAMMHDNIRAATLVVVVVVLVAVVAAFTHQVHTKQKNRIHLVHDIFERREARTRGMKKKLCWLLLSLRIRTIHNASDAYMTLTLCSYGSCEFR